MLRRYIMAYTVRSAEEKLRIVLEGMKAENISAMCRREGISPTDYYRYRDKLVEGGLGALRQNGRQKRDAEKESLKKELEKLKEIIVSQAGEIELLKKKTSSDW
jgi:transposase